MSEKLQKRLETLKDQEQLLSSWEKGFLDSVTQQFNKRGSLSPKQMEFIARFEEKISPEAIQAYQDWENLYRAEKRANALVVAKYYKETGYFQDLASHILTDENYVPPKLRWAKMCCNKYALKVLANYNAPSKYPDTSLVQLRTTADWRFRNAIGDTFCTVIQSGKEVGTAVSTAKGAKLYKILPFGSARVLIVEERHIKKAKKTKKVEKKLDDEILF